MMQATRESLEAGLDAIRQSPREEGVLELIVRRPQRGEREIVDEARLDVVEGLMGDCWARGSSARTPDGSPDVDMQLNVMNARVSRLLAADRSRWALSGDQLFIDMDLSAANLPPGTTLAIGTAIIVVTEPLHASCKAFATRYGVAAAAFVHSPIGKALRLRGINARVVQSGVVKTGDRVKKLRPVLTTAQIPQTNGAVGSLQTAGNLRESDLCRPVMFDSQF